MPDFNRVEKNKWLIWTLAYAVGLILFGIYVIPKLTGFMIYPDEFGYWAASGTLLGYDWSEIASLGSYYSYGYTLFLFPIYALIQDPTIAYRVALGLQLLMLLAAVLLLHCILQELFPKESRSVGLTYLFAGSAVLAPGMLCYSGLTLVEIPSMLVSLILIRLWQKWNSSTTTGLHLIWTALLMCAAGYLYALHRRMIGIVAVLAAGMMLQIFLRIRNGKKRRQEIRDLILMSVIGLLLFLALHICAKWSVATIFSGTSMKQMGSNSYQGQLGKLLWLATSEGWRDLALSFSGKLFYVLTATGGLAFYGWLACFRKTENKSRTYLVFPGLSLPVVLVVSAIKTMHPERVDDIFYGRYSEFILPWFVALGLYELMRSSSRKRRILAGSALGMQFATGGLMQVSRQMFHLSRVEGYMSIACSWWIHDEYNSVLDNPAGYLWQCVAFGAGCILALWLLTELVVLLRTRKGATYKELWLPAVLWLVAGCLFGVYASHHYVQAYNAYDSRDLELVSILENEEGQVYFIPSGSVPFIDQIQFQLRERQIHVADNLDSIQSVEQNQMNDHIWLILEKHDEEHRNQLRDSNLENGNVETGLLAETSHFALWKLN